MKPSICIISTVSPYNGQRAKEALDVALVSASYDLPTSFVLMEDGVYQLIFDQKSHNISKKSFSAMLEAVPLYGLNSIYVDENSLKKRNIAVNQLLENYIILPEVKLSKFISGHDRILTF